MRVHACVCMHTCIRVGVCTILTNPDTETEFYSCLKLATTLCLMPCKANSVLCDSIRAMHLVLIFLNIALSLDFLNNTLSLAFLMNTLLDFLNNALSLDFLNNTLSFDCLNNALNPYMPRYF